MDGWMDEWILLLYEISNIHSYVGFSRLGLPMTYDMKVSLKKLESPAVCQWKPNDLKVISFWLETHMWQTDRQTVAL